MVVGVDSLRQLACDYKLQLYLNECKRFFGITCRENPGPLDENLSEVVRVPDVVPESLRSFHQFDSSGLGVFCGLAALGLSLAEDDVAGEVH